jgi:hypothetical protein
MLHAHAKQQPTFLLCILNTQPTQISCHHRRRQQHDSIIKIKDGVGCYMRQICGMVFHESSNAGSVMEETSSRPKDDDFQGFSNKEISTSTFLDMVCIIRSFDDVNSNNVK